MDIITKTFSEEETQRIKNYYLPNVTIKQYMIHGRAKPTPKKQKPTIFKMFIFAKNIVEAKSKFCYYLNKLRKLKKRDTEILEACEVEEEFDKTINNYGIWFRWNSRDSTHNFYKEFRDISVCGAVQQMYDNMAAKHRAKAESIQIINTTVVKDENCKKIRVKRFIDDVKFPLNKFKLKLDKEDKHLLTYEVPILPMIGSK